MPHKLLFFLSNILIVSSTDRESSQQLVTWFSEHFFRAKICCIVCHCHCLERKNVKKTMFDPTSGMIRL